MVSAFVATATEKVVVLGTAVMTCVPFKSDDRIPLTAVMTPGLLGIELMCTVSFTSNPCAAVVVHVTVELPLVVARLLV